MKDDSVFESLRMKAKEPEKSTSKTDSAPTLIVTPYTSRSVDILRASISFPVPEPSPSSSAPVSTPTRCVRYEKIQRLHQGPLSAGKRQFPYSRPSPECRTFNLSSMEQLIEGMNGTIRDPDLFRLFENSYPNTLDTMIKWRGYAMEIDPATKNETVTDQELTYVITGDIDAMVCLIHFLAHLRLR
jgi:hypothetical protein